MFLTRLLVFLVVFVLLLGVAIMIHSNSVAEPQAVSSLPGYTSKSWDNAQAIYAARKRLQEAETKPQLTKAEIQP